MYLLSSANGERGTRAFIPRAIGRYATCHGFPWSRIAECGRAAAFSVVTYTAEHVCYLRMLVSHRSEVSFGAD